MLPNYGTGAPCLLITLLVNIRIDLFDDRGLLHVLVPCHQTRHNGQSDHHDGSGARNEVAGAMSIRSAFEPLYRRHADQSRPVADFY